MGKKCKNLPTKKNLDYIIVIFVPPLHLWI